MACGTENCAACQTPEACETCTNQHYLHHGQCLQPFAELPGPRKTSLRSCPVHFYGVGEGKEHRVCRSCRQSLGSFSFVALRVNEYECSSPNAVLAAWPWKAVLLGFLLPLKARGRTGP